MTDPAISNQLFTMQSLGTFSGVVGATFTVTNAMQRAFNLNPAWLGFLVAQVVCIGIVFLSGRTGSEYVVGFLNGCLAFLSAAGTSGLAGSATGATRAHATARSAGPARVARRRSFFSSWF